MLANTHFSVRCRFLILIAITMPLANSAQISAQEPSSNLDKLVGKETPLKKELSIAFFGDSITMQGGYIRSIEKAIRESEATKQLGIKLHQHGLNGGRVPTVLEGKSPWGKLGGTMAELLEKEKPTVVVICLGVNDVWHGKKGTTPKAFKTGLEKMIDLATKSGSKIVLCTPSVIGEEIKDNKLTDELGEYSVIIRELAKAKNLELCDLHRAFKDRLEKLNSKNVHQGHLTYDGVHMNDKGNALIANEISGSLIHLLSQRKD